MFCESTEIAVRPEHEENGLEPMLMIPLPIETLVKPEQPPKAPEPIVVTVLRMLIPVKFAHPLKAPFPIVITPLEMVKFPVMPSGHSSNVVWFLL